MPYRFLVTSAALAVAVATAPPVLAQNATSVCIENAGEEELVFVAEAHRGERNVQRVAPGGLLCAEAPTAGGRGTVGVFESEDALEGCSRLTAAGKTERLIGYASFDNCKWAER